ncbi:MAG: LysM peptidoglycan-binding domain-containing protein, partial [Phycisphaerales bacterium]
RAGQVLRIAVDPDNIQGVPLGAGPPPAPDANPTEHVVADGETLSGIAQSLYGKSSLWRVIYDANRHLLETPQDLRPGMRLLIPPAPAGAGQ